MAGLDERDMEVCGPLLDELGSLEREHSRVRLEWLQTEQAYKSRERALAEKVMQVRERLDQLMVGMQHRYGEEGQHVVFDVDSRSWVSPHGK